MAYKVKQTLNSTLLSMWTMGMPSSWVLGAAKDRCGITKVVQRFLIFIFLPLDFRCSAQQAADNDEYQIPVSRACASQSITTIGPTNLIHAKKLYTPTVPSLGYSCPSSFPTHQTYSLPGNICDTTWHAACNKGVRFKTDSIDLFSSLLKCSIPTVSTDL